MRAFSFIVLLGSVIQADVPVWLPEGLTEESVLERVEDQYQLIPPPASCPLKFEILHVQDTSTTYKGTIKEMQRSIPELMEDLKKFPGSKFGFASFCDKPTPISGFGDYAALPATFVRDHCFTVRSPLTDDATQVTEGIGSIHASGGGDYFENSYGAFLSAAVDPTIGFTTGSQHDGKLVVRLVLLATDALSHLEGDLTLNIKEWNDEFGHEDWRFAWLFDNEGACALETETYRELIELRKKYDNGEIELNDIRLKDLADLCGPWPMNESKVVKHPKKSESDEDCANWEYPNFTTVAEAIRAVDAVIPVTISKGSGAGIAFVDWYTQCKKAGARDEGSCLRIHWQNLFQEAGLKGIHIAQLFGLGAPTMTQIIKMTVNRVTQDVCDWLEKNPSAMPTAPPAPTTAPTREFHPVPEGPGGENDGGEKGGGENGGAGNGCPDCSVPGCCMGMNQAEIEAALSEEEVLKVIREHPEWLEGARIIEYD